MNLDEIESTDTAKANAATWDNLPDHGNRDGSAKVVVPNPQPVEVAGFTLLRSHEEWEAWPVVVNARKYATVPEPETFPVFSVVKVGHQEGVSVNLWPADVAAWHTAFGGDDAKRAEAAEARVERLRRALWAEQKAYNALYNDHNELWGDTIPPEFDCAEMPADWDDGTAIVEEAADHIYCTDVHNERMARLARVCHICGDRSEIDNMRDLGDGRFEHVGCVAQAVSYEGRGD